MSAYSNGMAAGLLASVIPNVMSDMVEPERCLVTIKNGSPPNVRRYDLLILPALLLPIGNTVVFNKRCPIAAFQWIS